MKMNKSGFTLIEIMIVVAIIIILATLAVPAFNQARIKSQAAVCVNNLRQIDGSYDQYFLEEGKAPASVAALTPEYIKRDATGECPASGVYSLPTAAGVAASCSIASTISADHPHAL